MEKTNKNKGLGIRSLTKNEKILFTILGVILFFWTSFRFIFEPQAAKIQSLEREKKQYSLLIEEQNRILRNEKQIKDEWETLNNEREKIISKYFPTLDQAQILYLLNDLTEDERVNIHDLGFTRPYKETKNDMEVEKMDINIPFNGTYDGIMDILRSVRNSPRSMIIDGLSIDREDSNNLAGHMNIKIYSLKDLVETDEDVIFVDVAEGNHNSTPFVPYEDYREPSNIEEIEESTQEELNIYAESKDNNVEDKVDKRKGQILYDFENRIYEFIPSNSMIYGNVLPSTMSKSGKFSLRLEYNILALEDENRAYVDLSSNNIVLKIPPISIGMWVYSYGYSPGTLGIRLRGQAGEEIDINLVEGITWTGWSYIEANLPNNMNLYPLKIDKIFYELPYEREDFGVLLFDKLEAFYSDNGDTSGAQNQFYIVKAGENITEISRKIYGTPAYKNEIMELNGIKPGDILPVGKILVIKSR